MISIGTQDAAIIALENFIVRLTVLTGPLGAFTAASIEGTRRREDLDCGATRGNVVVNGSNVPKRMSLE